MNVTEAEARRLLAAVKKTSEKSRAAQAAMVDASQARADAVSAALDAGIPRERIAEAAGVARTMIYRIATGH